MRGIIVTALALGFSSPVLASWELSSGDDNCAITGEYEDDGNSTITLAEHIDGGFSLFVTNDNWSNVEGRKYELAFVFDDEVFTGETTGFSYGSQKGFRIGGGQDLADAFRRARRLGIIKDTKTVVLIAGLAGSSAAMQRMSACAAGKRREDDRAKAEARALAEKRKIIPADPFYDPRSVNPIGNVSRWMTNDDYPAAAMREGREGTSAFRVTIDPSGMVTDCEITQSTGHADLDAETCVVVKRRARFDTAPKESGPRFYENRIRWQIPR